MSALADFWNRLTNSEASRSVMTTENMSHLLGGFNYAEQETQQKLGNYIRTNNAVYACSRARAQRLASLPIVLYKGVGKQRKPVERGRLYELLAKVNPYWTFNRLMDVSEMSMCIWGEAFWFIDGKREIWWAPSDKVSVKASRDKYISHFEYLPDGAAQPIRFEREETVWFRYPNPLDHLEPLSPLTAAAISADMSIAAQIANKGIFTNGNQMGGYIGPKPGSSFTTAQAKELEQGLTRRFSGADKRHKWAVFTNELDVKPLGVSPKDAEFMESLKWSLEEICRALSVPVDLVGGRNTYENVDAAQLSIWADTIKPEARLFSTEIVEQLLSLFPGEADDCEFDFSDVAILQESEQEAWSIASDKIAKGAITINEWREEKNLKAVPWGEVPWFSSTLTPIHDAEKPEPPPQLTEVPPADPKALPEKTDEEPRSIHVRAVAYGSAEHERMWTRAIAQMEPWEVQFGTKVAELMRRQKQAVLARLRDQRGARTAEDVASEPFDRARWVKQFREDTRSLYTQIVKSAGEAAIDEVNVAMSFDMDATPVKRMIEKSAQRFAVQVNDTTWDALKASLQEGITNGDSLDLMAKRIEEIMGDRIKSSGEAIARTEVISSSNAARIEGWKQSGTVDKKEWVAALDERTRASHVSAHGQTVALDADFTVGGATGPGPGNMSSAGESVNCRCVVVPVIDIDV